MTGNSVRPAGRAAWIRDRFMAVTLVAMILGLSTQAPAQDLQLDGETHWVAVASTQEVDAAIGIARLYRQQPVRVVRAVNGWYTVVFGPVAAPDIAAFRAQYDSWPQLPDDALLSRGDSYVETIWQPPATPVLAEGAFSVETPLTLEADGLRVTIAAQAEGEESSVTLTGQDENGVLFSLSLPAEYYSDIGSRAELVWLDRSANLPQVMLRRFTGGAHCCLDHWIVTQGSDGDWQIVEADMLDGGGYWFEDLDEDGEAELMSVDNNFLYAFDSYAGSFAPIRIEQVRNGERTDVSTASAFLPRYRQDLAGMEFRASIESELWQANGYLAGWAGTKARVGEIADALDRIEQTYDRDRSFAMMVCPDGSGRDNCAPDTMTELAFPVGLTRFLTELGYWPLTRR